MRLHRHELPPHIPTLADLYERCGHDFELSLDMGCPQAADAVMRVAAEHGATDRLWLAYWRLPTLALWRERWPGVHLVYPTIPLGRRHSLRQIERLAALQVDALNVFHRVCTPSLVERAHRHGLLLFAWGVRRRSLQRVVAHGADGVYCDDVEAMVAATRR